MPEAFNLPLFNDRERAQVGTTYKQKGKEAAVLLGLELVGPKMRSLAEEARRLAPEGQALVHCWRGGMRSESVAWLLQTTGMQAHTLQGGYKAYRNYLLDAFRQPASLLILGGETGSGKTAILHVLQELGEQVIDLEGLACHRGSAFGGIGMDSQPTSEQFANDLYGQWRMLDTSRRIWLEDESFSIGQVRLPYELWEQMRLAPVIKVTLPQQERVRRLVAAYGRLPREALDSAIGRIEKRLGGLQTQQAQEALAEGQLAHVAEILLDYYDKTYQRCLAKKKNQTMWEVICSVDDPYTNALKVREAATQPGIS